MPDFLLRNIQPEIYSQMKAHAQARGVPLGQWVLELVTEASAQPLVRARYAFAGVAENGARVVLGRRGEQPDDVEIQSAGCTAEQLAAVEQASMLAARNRVGDRESLVLALGTAGFSVHEVPI
ncbi:MAG: hypothetical protein ACR2M0_00445 [Chloroflexia bacterium]